MEPVKIKIRILDIILFFFGVGAIVFLIYRANQGFQPIDIAAFFRGESAIKTEVPETDNSQYASQYAENMDAAMIELVRNYLNNMVYLLRSNLRATANDSNQTAELMFNLTADGKVTTYEVTSASSEDYAKKVVASLSKSNSFGIFPKAWNVDAKTFRATFKGNRVEVAHYERIKYLKGTIAQPTGVTSSNRNVAKKENVVLDTHKVLSKEESANINKNLESYYVSDYLNALQKDINKNWQMSTADKASNAVVWLVLDNKGKVLYYHLQDVKADENYAKQVITTIMTTSYAPFYSSINKEEIAFNVEFQGDSVKVRGYNYDIGWRERVKAISYSYKDNYPKEVLTELYNKVKANWTPEVDGNNYVTELSFKLMKDGTVKDVEFLKKSDNAKFDSTALSALQNVRIGEFSCEEEFLPLRYTLMIDMNR